MNTEDDKQTVLSTLPKDLPLDFLKTITDQFSDNRVIGKGAFGTVYTGTMPDGQTIAVKKLAENAPIARDRIFNNEVQNIMAYRHENIVKLVGFCHEGQKKVVLNNGRYIVADVYEGLLCYEYLPKGSLQRNLFDKPIDMAWDVCFKIIKGICDGLHFLHSIPLIHMDLKPQNILLDDNMTPKISDFGLSRLFGKEQTRANTQNVVGSYGYIAPEYLYRGEISTQSDIYSLGLLIIETTTGEKNTPKQNEPSAREFIEREVTVCIEIGLECVDVDWKKRPSIESIVERLGRCCANLLVVGDFALSLELVGMYVHHIGNNMSLYSLGRVSFALTFSSTSKDPMRLSIEKWKRSFKEEA
ncbi:cysteine-rich receptor-like protein kinase 40 [Triticum dicoccoides]|uniref:cysteine-rich receptor-like protein kinase 40 n=1 Tax=Triticum dicoccoides TaxID=85692 RepID=UPI00188FADFB|nr:cysteine-rich receptor-like protein kinase 40 [Triticum dicoccoides]